ncbi:MAG: hypothetical protein K2J79_02840 [Ruminiclostridium sp.]|nr:hypothetical protein [Ruminiclostridium sp.]
MSVENTGDAFTQAFFLYVNAQINEYDTNEYPDKCTYHIYDFTKNSIKGVTLHLLPITAKKEKTFIPLSQ